VNRVRRREPTLKDHFERHHGPLPLGWTVVKFNHPVWNKFTLRPLPRLYRTGEEQ